MRLKYAGFVSLTFTFTFTAVGKRSHVKWFAEMPNSFHQKYILMLAQIEILSICTLLVFRDSTVYDRGTELLVVQGFHSMFVHSSVVIRSFINPNCSPKCSRFSHEPQLSLTTRKNALFFSYMFLLFPWGLCETVAVQRKSYT